MKPDEIQEGNTYLLPVKTFTAAGEEGPSCWVEIPNGTLLSIGSGGAAPFARMTVPVARLRPMPSTEPEAPE